MSPTSSEAEVEAMLDRLGAEPAVQSNCMFQLALMLARIAVEPCADGYKDDTAQALLALIRAKPKSNVVRLFGAATTVAGTGPDGPPMGRLGPPRDRPRRGTVRPAVVPPSAVSDTRG